MMLPDALQCYNWARDCRFFPFNIHQIVYRNSAKAASSSSSSWCMAQHPNTLSRKIIRSLKSFSMKNSWKSSQTLVCLPSWAWWWFSGVLISKAREFAMFETECYCFALSQKQSQHRRWTMQKYFDGITEIGDGIVSFCPQNLNKKNFVWNFSGSRFSLLVHSTGGGGRGKGNSINIFDDAWANHWKLPTIFFLSAFHSVHAILFMMMMNLL